VQIFGGHVGQSFCKAIEHFIDFFFREDKRRRERATVTADQRAADQLILLLGTFLECFRERALGVNGRLRMLRGAAGVLIKVKNVSGCTRRKASGTGFGTLFREDGFYMLAEYRPMSKTCSG
jgi:hypothetical protein